MNAMKSIAAGGFAAAAGLAVTVVGLAAPAIAAPSGTGNAGAAIAQLEAQGNRVIVNKLSDAPLADASIVAVNKVGDVRSTIQDNFGDDTRQQVVTGSVYYVDVR